MIDTVFNCTASGVTNYIVVTWDAHSLVICRRLNLPCYNAAPLLPKPVAPHNASKQGQVNPSGGQITFRSPEYIAMTWLKTVLVHEVLQRGYAVHLSDVDIAYFPFGERGMP